jgi:hypothetical protein
MTQPCKRDCPGRSLTCHAECEKYKAYTAQQREDYKRRLHELEVGLAQADAIKRMQRHR